RDFHVTGVQTCALPIWMTITIILLGALFLGESILGFFGISTSSFRIAGGLLLLITAYQMFANSSLIDAMGHQDAHSQGVVPLARSEERRVGKECRARCA